MNTLSVGFGLFFVAILYAIVVNVWGHHWRRLGLRWLEYVVAALALVGALRLAATASQMIGWRDYEGLLIAYYSVLGTPVIIGEVVTRIVETQIARRKRAQSESEEEGHAPITSQRPHPV